MRGGLRHEKPSSLAFPSLAEALARGPACFPTVPPPAPSAVNALAEDLRARMTKSKPQVQAKKEARALILRSFISDLVSQRNLLTGVDHKASLGTSEEAEDPELRESRLNSPTSQAYSSDSESFQSSSHTLDGGQNSDECGDVVDATRPAQETIVPPQSIAEPRQSILPSRPDDRTAIAHSNAENRSADDRSWIKSENPSQKALRDDESIDDQENHVSVLREPRQSILRRRSSDHVAKETWTTGFASTDAQLSDGESEEHLSGLVYNYETDASRSTSLHRSCRQSIASFSHRMSDAGGWEVRPLSGEIFSLRNGRKATTESIEMRNEDEDGHTPQQRLENDQQPVDRHLDFTELVRCSPRRDVERDRNCLLKELGDPALLPEYHPDNNAADEGSVVIEDSADIEPSPSEQLRENAESPWLQPLSPCDAMSVREKGNIFEDKAVPSEGVTRDKGLELSLSSRGLLKCSGKKRRPLAVINCNQIAGLRINIEPTMFKSYNALEKKPRPTRRKAAATSMRRPQSRSGGHPRQWRELKHLDVARARKAIERFPDPRDVAAAGESSGDSQNARRSKRQRFPVLKFWKGETIVYERRKSQIMPTISEIVLDGSESEESIGSSLRDCLKKPQRKRARIETVP